MKSLLGIQLNFSTSVQLLRAGTSPGVPYLLLDPADAEYPICTPHWKSEELNSDWVTKQWLNNTIPACGKHCWWAPAALTAIAAWHPELLCLVMVGQVPRWWGNTQRHLTSHLAAAGAPCWAAGVPWRGWARLSCWELVGAWLAFPWLCKHISVAESSGNSHTQSKHQQASFPD